MFARNLSISAAVCAALAFAGIACADVASNISPNISMVPPNSNLVFLDDAATMPASAPVATAPAATPVAALNSVLNRIPGYSDTGLSITGYAEGSWTYSAHPPAGNILTDRSFDTKTESLQFDAIDLLIARGPDSSKAFDIGFNLEQMAGWDSAYIHSNGLGLVSNGKTASNVGIGAGSTATIHPKTQYDLTQADVVLSFGKVGNGLTVTGGKFDTLVGFEVIDAPANPFFSHSFIFAEEPYTHTGLIAAYNVTDPAGPSPVTVTGGFSRGWDQATEDTNGNLDIMGQVKYTNTAGKFNLQLTGITGNEQPSGTQDGWRTILDFVGNWNYSDQLTFSANGLFGWQAQDANPLAGPGGDEGTAIWYGAAVYAKYVPSEYITFNARAEWFDDQDGGAPTQLAGGPNVGTPNQFYEVTLGVSITPLPENQYLKGLVIRPEGRWDYSDHAAFNGGAQHDQWTAAIEAVFAF